MLNRRMPRVALVVSLYAVALPALLHPRGCLFCLSPFVLASKSIRSRAFALIDMHLIF